MANKFEKITIQEEKNLEQSTNNEIKRAEQSRLVGGRVLPDGTQSRIVSTKEAVDKKNNTKILDTIRRQEFTLNRNKK